MMPNPSPLDQLHDIQLPADIHQWPIAPGHWLILLVVIATCAYLFSRWRQQRRYHAPRKQALDLLTKIDFTNEQCCSQVNDLLKRTALSYVSRADIACLTGDAWQQWLDQRMPATEQGKLGQLLALRFSPKPLSSEQANELNRLAHLWLTSTAEFSPPIPTNLSPSPASASLTSTSAETTSLSSDNKEAKC